MNKEENKKGLFPQINKAARNSTFTGIIMLACWILPMIGIPLGLIGLTMGVTGLPSKRRDLARAGIFLNGLGLGLTILNVFLSFYLLKTGKLDSLLMIQ